MTKQRWMLFVDGENLTLRAQEVATAQGREIGSLSCVYRKDECFWPKGWLPRLHPFASDYEKDRQAVRAYYYTGMAGDTNMLRALEMELHGWGFNPVVFKKQKGTRTKGVDLMLAKDMLMHGFHGHYDIAVLVSGDGDYVPIVDEVKRHGRNVVVSFFRESQGLSSALRLAADRYQPFDLLEADFHFIPS